MAKKVVVVFICLLTNCSVSLGVQKESLSEKSFEWSQIPHVPLSPSLEKPIRVAGSFVGVHNNVLIIAGGANLPDIAPWEVGKRIFSDDIFILQKGDDGKYKWLTDTGVKLPRPLSYGVSISTADGIVCIGGVNSRQCYSDVFLLKWNPTAEKIEIETLPALPVTLAFMAGASVNQKIYVAAGRERIKDPTATNNFWSLDLAKKDSGQSFAWKQLPDLPGAMRILPACAAQSDGQDDCFYLFGGHNVSGGKGELLTDAYKYNPRNGTWTQLESIALTGRQPRALITASAIASGTNHILAVGGDDGKVFVQLQQLRNQIKQTSDKVALEVLKNKLNQQLESIPDFKNEILAFHTITDTWVKIGNISTIGTRSSVAVELNGEIVIISDSVDPDIATPLLTKGKTKIAQDFGVLNYSVLVVYFSGLLYMGIYFSRREKSTEDFFKASGRVPWWAAGLSIFGTMLSAITFMALPAKTFATDWRYFFGAMTIPIIAPFIIFFFLPFYRRLNITTAYEYLEQRFNLVARLIGSIMFIALQIGRIGIVMFLPSIALSVVTGIDVRICILAMGILCTTYTVLGGIEAVIWNDVIQTTRVLP